jgi:excisionase family DNA binding protein
MHDITEFSKDSNRLTLDLTNDCRSSHRPAGRSLAERFRLRFFAGSPINQAKLMSLKEFAVHLGVSYSTVRRMVADKSIRVVMPHRRAMIPASEAEKFTSSGGQIVEELETGT